MPPVERADFAATGYLELKPAGSFRLQKPVNEVTHHRNGTIADTGQIDIAITVSQRNGDLA